MANINVELFKRYQPKKKLEIINKLTKDELLRTSKATVERIVKEAGEKSQHSRSWRLRISRDLRSGNGWNSDIEEISLWKGKLYLDVYVQMDHTDTTIEAKYEDFFRSGSDYRGTAYETDRYGADYPHHCFYDDDDKAKVMRSILIQYVRDKYADKLKND